MRRVGAALEGFIAPRHGRGRFHDRVVGRFCAFFGQRGYRRDFLWWKKGVRIRAHSLNEVREEFASRVPGGWLCQTSMCGEGRIFPIR